MPERTPFEQLLEERGRPIVIIEGFPDEASDRLLAAVEELLLALGLPQARAKLVKLLPAGELRGGPRDEPAN